MLTRAKFEINPIPRAPRMVGLFPCGNCTYCKRGYITQSSEFVFKRNNKLVTWTYNRMFSCNSLNILYIVKSLFDEEFYLGKTTNAKERMSKHISDINIPANSNCIKCALHLGKVSGMKEPYFRFYPFFYVDDPHLRSFMEKRFVQRFKPTLNLNLVKK